MDKSFQIAKKLTTNIIKVLDKFTPRIRVSILNWLIPLLEEELKRIDKLVPGRGGKS